MKAASVSPGRSKRLFAIVTGCGRGKTRAITEIRNVLLSPEYNNVFVMAVTFNSSWSVSQTLDYWDGVVLAQHSYALSVVARMAAMYFCKDFDDIVRQMKMYMREIVRVSKETSGKHVIQQFIVWMVTALRKKYRPIDAFILLVDEIAAMEEFIQKRFGTRDAADTLRTALLQFMIVVPIDESAFFQSDSQPPFVLKTSLVLSSLYAKYVESNSCGHPVYPILLSPRLDCTKVTDIWVETLNSRRIASSLPPVSCTESYALTLIAATVNDVPRFIQFVNDILRKCSISIIDGNLISALYTTLLKRVSMWYCSSFSWIEDRILIAIILKQSIPMDNENLAAAILNSVIANSIVDFSLEHSLSDIRASFLLVMEVVKGAPMSRFRNFLHIGLTAIFESLQKAYIKAEEKMILSYHAVLWSHHSADKYIYEGIVLETFIYHWLKIKLVAVAADVITPGTSLQALLTLPDELLPPEYWGYFKALLHVGMDFDIPTVELPVKSDGSSSTLLRASDRGCNRSISKVVSGLGQNCAMEVKLNEWRKRKGEGKDIANRTRVALMLPR